MHRTVYPHKEVFDGNSAFRIYKKRISAGEKTPLHWHDYLEFECIISGSAEHIYNDRTYRVQRGDVYLMQCYDFHALLALTDVTLYSLHIHEQLLEPMLVQALQCTRLCLSLEETALGQLLAPLERLLAEAEGTQPYRDILLRSLLNYLFAYLLRFAAPQGHQPPSLLIQRAVSYMQAHYRSPLTLRTLADELNYSPNYLGHLFTIQLGYSFQEYLHILRLKHACSLLQSSDLTISEVAASSGYQSAEYFSQVFKKKLGIPPMTYRKEAQPSVDPASDSLSYRSIKLLF